jgi:hypothetical protein
MRGNKDLFPPPNCWTRGMQEGEESLSSLFVVYAREMRKSNGGVGLGWPATKGEYFEWIPCV